MIRTIASVALLLALTACGSLSDGADSDGSTSAGSTSEGTSSSSSAYPVCDDVWKVGATLPDGYLGCEKDGATIVVPGWECDGSGRLFPYDNATADTSDDLYGYVGGPIAAGGSDTTEFMDAYDTCVG